MILMNLTKWPVTYNYIYTTLYAHDTWVAQLRFYFGSCWMDFQASARFSVFAVLFCIFALRSLSEILLKWKIRSILCGFAVGNFKKVIDPGFYLFHQNLFRVIDPWSNEQYLLMNLQGDNMYYTYFHWNSSNINLTLLSPRYELLNGTENVVLYISSKYGGAMIFVHSFLWKEITLFWNKLLTFFFFKNKIQDLLESANKITLNVDKFKL